jgi:enterochelin esterase-like enzyme
LIEREYAGRRVRMLLPPGYSETRPLPHPLLILHDGQNLFEEGRADSTAPGGGSWRADETIAPLIASARIPPLVVCGVDHAGVERISEFTPTPDARPGAGRASEYARFVVAELLPRLSREYHVRTDAGGLGLGGSSMGGLVTLWMAILFPGLFGRLIVMSPSLWWDRRVVLRHLRRHEIDPLPRIWLDAGRKEGTAVTRDARELHKLLRRQSRTAVRYVEDPRGDHSESSWGRRLPDALVWLYGLAGTKEVLGTRSPYDPPRPLPV